MLPKVSSLLLPRTFALELSTALPHASDWLNVVPLSLLLHDQEFRFCLRYWLGLPLYADPSLCQRPADPFGDHQIGCGRNGDRIFRHNSLRDILFAAALSAALAPRKEAPTSCSSRPADILLPNSISGRPAALDVSVISPLQRVTLADAANLPGSAIQVGVRRKVASNFSDCQASGLDFIPLIVETLGG